MADGLLAEAVRRGGYRRGAHAASFVHGWALVEHELGQKIGIEEFARFTGMSKRTAYRSLRRFREVFPEARTPSDMIVPKGEAT